MAVASAAVAAASTSRISFVNSALLTLSLHRVVAIRCSSDKHSCVVGWARVFIWWSRSPNDFAVISAVALLHPLSVIAHQFLGVHSVTPLLRLARTVGHGNAVSNVARGAEIEPVFGTTARAHIAFTTVAEVATAEVVIIRFIAPRVRKIVVVIGVRLALRVDRRLIIGESISGTMPCWIAEAVSDAGRAISIGGNGALQRAKRISHRCWH